MLEALQEMLDREPFIPFRLTLTSGETFDVRNPYLVAMGQSVATVFHPRSDRFAILRLNQIASLDTLEPAA
jgi:hypothetical protein